MSSKPRQAHTEHTQFESAPGFEFNSRRPFSQTSRAKLISRTGGHMKKKANSGSLSTEKNGGRKTVAKTEDLNGPEPRDKNAEVTMNSIDGIDEMAAPSVSWIPYENCNYEMLICRSTPLCYYRCRYSLQKLFNKSLLRVYGVEITTGGILFCFLLFTLTFYLGYDSSLSTTRIRTSGQATSITNSLLFAFSGRNSIWIFLTGVSYERTIIWHKIIGLMALGLGILHTVYALLKSAIRIFGIMLIAGIGGGVIISFLIKMCDYKLFLLFHRFIIVMVIVASFFHHGTYAFIGMGLWGFDVLVRMLFYCINRSRVQHCTARLKSKSIAELSFPKKNFKYKAGQYVFLIVPDISLWEPHPFSLSSSPHQEYVTLHIRVVGDWTKRLVELTSRNSRQLSVYIDGPYGSPSIDIEHSESNAFMLISGGIGVTPMISIANWLLHQVNRGRPIKKIAFYWAVRDMATLKAVVNRHDLLVRFKNSSQKQGNKSKILYRRIFQTRPGLDTENLAKTYGRSFAESVIQRKMNLKQLFENVNHYRKATANVRLNVLCCGPKHMIDQASLLSKKYGLLFHGEVFDL